MRCTRSRHSYVVWAVAPLHWQSPFCWPPFARHHQFRLTRHPSWRLQPAAGECEREREEERDEGKEDWLLLLVTETHRGLRQKSFKRPLDDVAWRRKAAAEQPAAAGAEKGGEERGSTSMLPGMARQLGSRSPHKIRKFDVVQQAKLKWRRGRQRDDDDGNEEAEGRTQCHHECMLQGVARRGGGGGGCVAATLLGLSTCDAAAIKIHSCRGARRERQASARRRGMGDGGHGT